MAVGLGRVRLHEGEGGAVAQAVGEGEGGELGRARDGRDAPPPGAIAPGGGRISRGRSRISRGRSLGLQREQAAAQEQRAP
jgi:hypothetical protein